MAANASRRLETHHTTSGGEPLEYADIGAGTPVLWLFPFHAPLAVHWNLSGSWSFVQELARQYRLILVDDRHKQLDLLEEQQPVPEDYLSGLVADAIAALDAAGVERCHVVASLMTSIPAVALAARYPARVESLLLWDALLSGPELGRSEPVRKMIDLVWGDDAEVANRSWIGVSGLVGDAEDAREHKELFSILQFRQIRDRVAMRGLGASDASTEAPAVRCRTLVVLPTAAVMPGKPLTEATARAIPGARLARVGGAAISPDLEAHTVSLPVVLDWLAEGGQVAPTSRRVGAPPDRRLATLTAREREVCMEAAKGQTNAEIAEALSISRWTVQRHISNSIRKTGASNRAGLAALVAGEGHEAHESAPQPFSTRPRSPREKPSGA